MIYYKRHIDAKLSEWKDSKRRLPLMIRGARQVGKSTAVRQLGRQFKYFVEINLEKQPSIRQLFTENIDVKKTCEKLSGTLAIPIIAGETLLFIDEIQVSKEAIMALRYFKEDYPELHVIAAGSLLEFALDELPSFGVGRIRSMYMYPFSFDEFLMAQGLELSVKLKRETFSKHERLNDVAHANMIDQSVALQVGQKFVCSQVDREMKSTAIKDALHLLSLAGLVVPVVHSNANGLPLGAEENDRYVKYLFFDLGVMQTMLGNPASDILMSNEVDFVNKGGSSEMFAGLEMVKYADCFQKAELHYWQKASKGSQAEVDYVVARHGKVIPVEVKASTQGGMQSLWVFMREHKLCEAVRCSLENFGGLRYVDSFDGNAERNVDIIPLYALDCLFHN